MGFKFSLEAVLKHRKRLEDEAHVIFAEAQARLTEAKEILQSYYNSIDQNREDISRLQASNQKNAVPLILEKESFISGQGLRIEQHRKLMRQLIQDLEEKQEAYLLALRERKTLEKLKEKRKREFDMEVARREALELDEIATIRAGPP